MNNNYQEPSEARINLKKALETATGRSKHVKKIEKKLYDVKKINERNFS